MREFGCGAIWLGLGMMLFGLLNINAGARSEFGPYALPSIYIGGWFSFIGCLVSLIGSAWPDRKQKQETSSSDRPVGTPSNNAKAKVAERDS